MTTTCNEKVRFSAKSGAGKPLSVLTIVCAIAASGFATAAVANDVSSGSEQRDRVGTPEFYQELCAAQIDLGNDGDDWLDALDGCVVLKKQLESLRKGIKPDQKRAAKL